jgi:hypothetical protein
MEPTTIKEELAAALSELVYLKERKDKNGGKDAFYVSAQPRAWKYARYVLQRYEEEKERNAKST